MVYVGKVMMQLNVTSRCCMIPAFVKSVVISSVRFVQSQFEHRHFQLFFAKPAPVVSVFPLFIGFALGWWTFTTILALESFGFDFCLEIGSVNG